jgi:hypothetical protein
VLRIIAALTIALVAALPGAANARVFVGVGIGVPGPFYYGPPVYYAPPPVYYAPPPAYYPPPAPPVYYAPPAPPAYYTPNPVPAPTAAAPQPSGNCRQYNGDATIDGQNQPFYGTACLQADGKWHIMSN